MANTNEKPGHKTGDRIAKRLARAGLCSRREAERLILEGRVKVNGTVLGTAATIVGNADMIEVDGKALPVRERTRLWLFHKPTGLVTTNRDPEGRPTVFGALPQNLPRVVAVGRLDMNTEGLLLLTNDGGLARILELPETGWLRRYRVRAHGTISQAQIEGLRGGIAVDGILYGPIEAAIDRIQGSNVWLTMGLREGKNREIKKVLGALGMTVNRLIRISYGPFQLGELKRGAVLELRGRALRDQLGPRLIRLAGAEFDGAAAEPARNPPGERKSSHQIRHEGSSGSRPPKRGAGSGKRRRKDEHNADRRR